MTKISSLICILCFLLGIAKAETLILSTSNTDYQITNTFSDVDLFTIDIEIDIPLMPGIYTNPTINSVDYRVFGSLAQGTPSGFPSFDLRRSITGAEFYAQGSSLSFEIADTADFSDGIQASELVDNGFLISFNAREIDNGRFHPALFELMSDGTGRIQNSDNIHTLDPLLQVNFGDEYITDLMFIPSQLTLITQIPVIPVPPPPINSNGGTISFIGLLFLVIASIRKKLQTKSKSSAHYAKCKLPHFKVG
jgi:hypothetical protein